MRLRLFKLGGARLVMLAYALGVLWSPMLSVTFSYSDPDLGAVSSASSYCANYKNKVKLSEDRTILCFDGRISPNQDPGVFHDLNQNGLFVVRSPGGFQHTAITLSNILGEKNATVVIYDYCLSACANYFFIASATTYVRKNAIVAWHPSTQNYDCRPVGIEFVERQYRQRYGNDLARQYAEAACNTTELATKFFMDRGIDPRHIHAPQTIHTKKIFEAAIGEAVNKRNIFWMWHPQNYGNYFGSRIIYESYPNSQYDVDEIVSRLRLPVRVFYDPPIYPLH